MNVRVEQENVSPQVQSTSPSNCMVVRGGTIPASLQPFPGMEHDRTLLNELSQETSSNGFSQFVETPREFDDDKEIEAAAAASENKESPKTLPANRSPTPPVIRILPETAPSNQTLSPLHINVNDCSKIDSQCDSSRDSKLSSNGSSVQKTVFQTPSLRITDRASTSTDSNPIVMGPPSSTNTQVLLSPAGNLHNGFPRKSSGDSSPSVVRAKGNKSPHQFSFQRNHPSQRSNNISGVSSRPSSSLASPQGGGRKDHEMTRRRALVDRITKCRGSDYVHLLPQTEGLSHTQTSILLRKNRGTLITEGMPYSMQKLIDCGPEADKTDRAFVEKIREANQKRIRHNNQDELTDVSDLEDDHETSNAEPKNRRSPKNFPRWTPKRMRYSGMLSRAETLLDEKIALLGMLKNQYSVMDGSAGVRFEKEEPIPRRRRQLNGMYFLYDKSAFRRVSANHFGCSRAMPIQSWTKRSLQQDIFEESTSEKPQSAGPAVVKPSLNPSDKWVATAQKNVVTYLTNGEKREITEYDYEEYKAGEGIQRVNELSSLDPIEFVVSSDFNTFEDRQMSYLYRQSTAPSCIIRKKHGKSVHFEIDDRKPLDQNSVLKKKTDKKKERKPVEEDSSNDEIEEEETEEPKVPSKKRPRGRPATTKRKSSKMSVAAKLSNGIYLDYLFEDFMAEDVCTKQLPNKITYASIAVPNWYKIPEDYWDDVPASSKTGSDDLLIPVAKQHHKLMHAERDRIKRETDKRIRNRQAPTLNEDGLDADGYPPFDMQQFEPDIITSRRLYVSVVTPYEQRDFLNNLNSQSTT
ncbi:hypothetical protein GCK72_010474 [Caenorhabditis remanei]|uniref:Uncharacterized protein n=1 Tax=Caenorhabditis remanei TaxID=31234 RepID=A0A6A5H761_CAERE|nr:hypothetical protein GCK72_010474 [Caenorhabditis remanei]KAF1762212.1 hypothetical protein GCK72_010474 [Caenorhabditis remanei]